MDINVGKLLQRLVENYHCGKTFTIWEIGRATSSPKLLETGVVETKVNFGVLVF